MSKPPTKFSGTIDDLKTAMKKLGVSDANLEKFQDEIDDADHDIESINEDISDKEQSMLVDFFRDDLGDEKIYDIVKSIMDGKKYNASATSIDNNQTDSKEVEIKHNNQQTKPGHGSGTGTGSNKHVNTQKQKTKTNQNIQQPSDDNQKSVSESKISNENEEKKEWIFNKEEKNGGDGTVILNAGLIIIPDEVITNDKYLESIDGITYVLYYNNCGLLTGECRLPYSYIEFWNEYLNEETPTFSQISADIEHNEGPTYDYLMEHPPNDRILPVLEKVVDQLKYPKLDSNKEKRRKQIYKTDITNFFEKQTPDFSKIITHNIPSLIKTCVLFKTNTNDTNFNTFELFINMCDIYDRIIFNPEKPKITKPFQITGQEFKNIKTIKGHFAKNLDHNDYLALNDTMVGFKDIKKGSFFPKLELPLPNNENELIADNLEAFQMISLSFMLFIKSFMCETGNCLEKGNHIYKPPKQKGKNRKKLPKNAPFIPIIKSLLDIKKENANKGNKDNNAALNNEEEKKEIIVDDNDIFFHNDNMPLQFDLCIIPKGNNSRRFKTYNEFGLELSEYKSFEIKSSNFQTPINIQTIYQLYGQLIDVFRKTIIAPKNKNNISQNIQNVKDKKPPKRRDDRYCIVFDRNTNKFYIYPPHIKNGNGKITHRKSIITNKQDASKSSADNNNNNNPPPNNNNNIDGIDEVNNKFSLISHEYNDLTNFYLTNKCIIPNKNGNENGECFGINKSNENGLQFVLSAHFHKQRQWHRHPKLRLYQYFNGQGLRFFYSNKKDIQKKYKCHRDIIDLWPKYFIKSKSNSQTKVNYQFIKQSNIFDAVLDLYKCDAQYFQWDNAVKRQLH